MTNKTYKIEGMDCESCAKMIELDLEDAGITSCKCSFSDQTLEVSQEHDKDKVIEIVTKSGYSIKHNNS